MVADKCVDDRFRRKIWNRRFRSTKVAVARPWPFPIGPPAQGPFIFFWRRRRDAGDGEKTENRKKTTQTTKTKEFRFTKVNERTEPEQSQFGVRESAAGVGVGVGLEVFFLPSSLRSRNCFVCSSTTNWRIIGAESFRRLTRKNSVKKPGKNPVKLGNAAARVLFS